MGKGLVDPDLIAARGCVACLYRGQRRTRIADFVKLAKSTPSKHRISVSILSLPKGSSRMAYRGIALGVSTSGGARIRPVQAQSHQLSKGKPAMPHRIDSRGDRGLAVGRTWPTGGGDLPDSLRQPPAHAILIPENVQTSTPRGRSPLPLPARQFPRQANPQQLPLRPLLRHRLTQGRMKIPS